MATGVSQQTMDLLNIISQFLLFFKSCVTPCPPLLSLQTLQSGLYGLLLLLLWQVHSEVGPVTSDDNDNEYTTELELSPFSTIRRKCPPLLLLELIAEGVSTALGLNSFLFLLFFDFFFIPSRKFLLLFFLTGKNAKKNKEEILTIGRTDFAN